MKLDDYVKANPVRKGTRCTVGALDPQIRKQVDAAPWPDLPHSVVARWLSAETGTRFTDMTVGRHRRRECACE